MFVNVVSFVCNLGGDELSGCADGEWLIGVVRLWCCLCGAVHWSWEGRGGVWFGPAWVAEEVWGRVWWRSVADWVEGVSMGAAWLDGSIF